MSETEGDQVSIVQAIDVEVGGVDEEIRALEAQLEVKRDERGRLMTLRADAEAFEGRRNREGGGLPDPAPTPPPAPKPAEPKSPIGSSAGSGRQAQHGQLWAAREDQVLAAIRNAGDGGLSPAGIREATGLSKQQVEITIRKLGDKVSAEGTRKSRRYFEAEDGADRPNPAPAQDGRAMLAPRKFASRRNHEAAEKHNALRGKVKAAVLAVLADGPMGKDRLNAAVLERVPEASPEDVAAVRTNMMGKSGQIEMRANKVTLSEFDRTKPITRVEEEVVAALGSGRTAREVAANCKLVRDAFAARTICAALVSRGVIAQRADSSPPVYERLDELAEAA
jgi:hypothetical protein